MLDNQTNPIRKVRKCLHNSTREVISCFRHDGVRVKRKLEIWKEGRSDLFCEDLPGNMRRTNKTVLWLDRLLFTWDRLLSYKVFFSTSVVQACLFDCCFCSNVALAEKKSQNPLHYRDFTNFPVKFKNNDQSMNSVWYYCDLF